MSTLFNVWIAHILLSEQLQIPVEVVQYVGDDHQYYDHAASGAVKLPARAYNWDALVRASNGSCASYPTHPSTPEEECSHAMLELWSGQDANRAKYIGEFGGSGTVKHAGALGALGRIGWYANNEVLDSAPELASFRGLRNANVTAPQFRRPLRFSEACAQNVSVSPSLCSAFAAAFVDGGTASVAVEWRDRIGNARESFYVEALETSAHAALEAQYDGTLPSPLYGGAFIADVDAVSGAPVGTLLSVLCSWTEYDAQIVGANGLALRQRRYPWAEIMQIVTAAQHRSESILLYGWEPSSIVARGQHSRLSLPRYSSTCESARMTNEERCAGGSTSLAGGGGCNYPVDVIYKAVSKGLAAHAPTAEALLRSLQVSTEDHLSFLKQSDGNSSALRDATFPGSGVLMGGGVWGPLRFEDEERLTALAAEALGAEGASSAYNWGLDVVDVDERTGGHALSLLFPLLMRRHGLFDDLEIDVPSLSRFIAEVERRYGANPYHNRMHAADVTHAMSGVLQALGLAERVTPLQCLAALFAAAIHDFAHPGSTNAHEVKALTPSALRYSDNSVLEHHHLEAAFTLLHTPGYNFLRQLPRADYREFRATVIAMVCATDLKRHFEYISRLNSMKPAALARRQTQDEATDAQARGQGDAETPLALEVALKFCDLGHSLKPWAQHERWSKWVTEEFYLLGDSEKLMGCGISALCDREKDIDLPKSQCGFFNFVCLPFYSACAHVWPESEAVGAARCQANFEVWQARMNDKRASGGAENVSSRSDKC